MTPSSPDPTDPNQWGETVNKPAGNSQLPCRTCKGVRTIKIEAQTNGKAVEVKQVTCPTCRGSGTAGYITK